MTKYLQNTRTKEVCLHSAEEDGGGLGGDWEEDREETGRRTGTHGLQAGQLND